MRKAGENRMSGSTLCASCLPACSVPVWSSKSAKRRNSCIVSWAVQTDHRVVCHLLPRLRQLATQYCTTVEPVLTCCTAWQGTL